MRRVLLTMVLLSACAGNQSAGPTDPCIARADEKYSACVRPVWTPAGEQQTLVTSDQSQACRVEHQQALSLCGHGDQPPEIKLGTGTATTAH